jgi:hypothetical protein
VGSHRSVRPRLRSRRSPTGMLRRHACARRTRRAAHVVGMAVGADQPVQRPAGKFRGNLRKRDLRVPP